MMPLLTKLCTSGCLIYCHAQTPDMLLAYQQILSGSLLDQMVQWQFVVSVLGMKVVSFVMLGMQGMH